MIQPEPGFPGGFRTAVESLPADRRARGIATSFSGGAVGAIAGGSWSAANVVLLPVIGSWFEQGRYSHSFWLMALCQSLGLLLWIVLSRPPRSHESAAV